jgi:DNA-binding protein WhiA
LQASERQIQVIRRMAESGLIQTLPDSLKITAELRVKFDQMSMKELGEAHEPPITKSGVSHRLAKIMDFARAAGIED